MQDLNNPAHKTDSAAKGVYFLRILQQKDCMYFLCFLSDVLNSLSSVSESFQQKTATIGDVFQELTAAKLLLEKYKDRLMLRFFVN